MKIILTGATGFVGGEILKRLSAKPDVERITCLTRTAPATLPPKTAVILHSDFSRYDDQLLDTISDHSGCIWALGAKARF